MHTRYWLMIVQAAKELGLDPLLVEAIVLTESSGNTDAFRFEPDFYNRYIKPKKLFPGENPRRISSSYGLMQLMYPVAIERGLDPTVAPEILFQPAHGLLWGCKQLRMLLDWAETFDATPQAKLEAAVASYNGGRGGNKPTESPKRNASYVRKVFANLDTLKKIGAAA